METSLLTGTIGGVSVAGILGIVFAVYKCVNHRRCRSMCCGKKMEVSLDIEETTPPDKLTIKVPSGGFPVSKEEPNVPKPSPKDK